MSPSGLSADRKTSLQTWGALVLVLVPGLTASSFFPVVDSYPTAVCLLGGIVGAVGTWRLLERYPSFRARFRFLDGWLAATGAGWVLLLLGPSLGLAFGLTANRLLDRSPPVEHPTTILSIKRSRKGVDSAYLASWRPPEQQLLVPFAVGSPMSKVPRNPGTRLVVTTRRGAFGFSYISAATVTPDTTVP